MRPLLFNEEKLKILDDIVTAPCPRLHNEKDDSLFMRLPTGRIKVCVNFHIQSFISLIEEGIRTGQLSPADLAFLNPIADAIVTNVQSPLV